MAKFLAFGLAVTIIIASGSARASTRSLMTKTDWVSEFKSTSPNECLLPL